MPLIILAILLLVFLYLISPSLRRHPDREVMKGLKIAHRGLHDNNKTVPENSLLAARKAIDKGYAIENDIHLTRDGEVVVFHDDTALRMCGVDRKIEDMTLAEIKELRLAGTTHQIPTLKEFLDEVDGAVPILIEIKCRKNTCNALCDSANKILKDYHGKYFIQSFYPFALLWYRRHRKDVLRGQLSGSFRGHKFYERVLTYLLYNFISRPDFVSYEIKYSKNFARRLVTILGAQPVGWCFKSDEDIKKYGAIYDAHIFEDFLP